MKTCKHCGIELDEIKHSGYQCYPCKNGLERYNMNRIDMVEMHVKQEGKCLLCSKPVTMFTRRKPDSGYIDHNHETREVRGILCHPCNTSLGYIERAKINPDTIKEYLAS